MNRTLTWWQKPLMFVAVMFFVKCLVPPRRSVAESALVAVLLLLLFLPIAYYADRRRRTADADRSRRYGPGTGRRAPTERRPQTASTKHLPDRR